MLQNLVFLSLSLCLWGGLWWRSPTHLTLPLETWAGKPSWSCRLLMCPNLSWKHGAMRPWENINIKNLQTRGFQGRRRDANNDPRGEVGCSWVSSSCSPMVRVLSVQPCILFGTHHTLIGFQFKTGGQNSLGRFEVKLLMLRHVVREGKKKKSEVYPTGSKGIPLSQMASKLF